MCLSTAWAVLPLAITLTATSQTPSVFGYRDFTQQAKWDAAFAGQHLKILTAETHWTNSPEAYKTALYVANKFKTAAILEAATH